MAELPSENFDLPYEYKGLEERLHGLSLQWSALRLLLLKQAQQQLYSCDQTTSFDKEKIRIHIC